MIPGEYETIKRKTKSDKPPLPKIFRQTLVSFLGEYALWIKKESRCSHRDLVGHSGVLEQIAIRTADEFNVDRVS
jgi:hypothetical protein